MTTYTINHPIAQLMLDTFDAYDARQNPDSSIHIRTMIMPSLSTLTIIRCDLTDDCATMHLALDDELHDLLLIAIFDRDSLELRTLILDADSTTAILLPIAP